MDHHAARARHPLFARGVLGKTFDKVPVVAIVCAAKQNAGVRTQPESIGIIRRTGSDMPDALQRCIREFTLRGQPCLSYLPSPASVGTALEV